MQSPFTIPPTPKFAPICGQKASSKKTSFDSDDRNNTKFSPRQLMLLATPVLMSLDSAIANHPFGKGGGTLFDAILFNLLVPLLSTVKSLAVFNHQNYGFNKFS